MKEEDKDDDSTSNLKTIDINLTIDNDTEINENQKNLEKMTISELKQYIESKGEKISSKKTKKSDILEYIKTNNL